MHRGIDLRWRGIPVGTRLRESPFLRLAFDRLDSIIPLKHKLLACGALNAIIIATLRIHLRLHALAQQRREVSEHLISEVFVSLSFDARERMFW